MKLLPPWSMTLIARDSAAKLETSYETERRGGPHVFDHQERHHATRRCRLLSATRRRCGSGPAPPPSAPTRASTQGLFGPTPNPIISGPYTIPGVVDESRRSIARGQTVNALSIRA